ncbi:hypothetical protein ACH5AJ_33350 [Streptomyces rochei]|uniref:Uncharacterized protein n=1 Tax=Streptomyces vinaceusdrappus TaxID=67376 RepID=A0ABY6C4D0_9ACTN|nr:MULTISPECIES: hypothetical protein [Streptomyces]NUV96943.1 hypothetical protein [Streptomyces sp. KAI 90]RSS23516.1 hypothetical protein EF916_30045 [Streptomyces sp. WAC08452]UXI82845.1 hypothetical protein N6Q81_34720 [Streptomyces vinaceusdrappus]
MPKKRNAAQRIGAIGEDRFRLSCQENFIIPNKVEHDFGFDFLCQADLSADFGETGPVSGVFVGFSVRATDRDDGRIRLNRADAECLLAAQFPTGLALVKLDGPKTASVYFRMMDASFIVELSQFLTSAKKSRHFTPKDMRPMAEIRDAFRKVSAVGYLEQVRADAARKIAEPITGPVQIRIHRDSGRQATLITSLDLYAWFEQGTPAEQEALYLATFGEPERRDRRMRQLALNGKAMGGLVHLPQPYVLAGFVMDHPTGVCVHSPSGSAHLPVLRTANERHFGYIHPAGFALTVSSRVEQDGQYVHMMRALADPDSDALLGNHPALLAFLTACHPESVFSFDDRDGPPLDARYFVNLGDLAQCAAAFRDAQRLDGWDAAPVMVKDMASPESRNSLVFLASAADPQTQPIPRGLLLTTPDVEEEDCDAVPGAVNVPVVCNLADSSLVVWFSGHGSVLFHNGDPCGFTVPAFGVDTIEVRARVPSRSLFPQVHLGPRTLLWDAGRWAQGDAGTGRWADDLRLRFQLD